MKSHKRRFTRAFATVAVASLLMAGCSTGSGEDAPEPSDDDGDSGSSEAAEDTGGALESLSELSDGFVRPDSGGDPVEGGTFRWAAYAEPASLDPAKAIYAATTGGMEMLNIYDTITRWDADAGEYVPQTAESVEPNDTFDEWTVTIHEGITFSDGTDYDAEAVKASQDRYAASPAPEAGVWNLSVDSVEVVDSHTVLYKLTESWQQFPALLSTGPGAIVGANSGEGEDFTPIGAGPFVLENWEAAESITLAAREDYWDGKPHLDKFVSVFLNDQQVAIESLDAGSVDAAFALQASYVKQLLVDKGYNGQVAAVNGGSLAIINAEEGFPGHDVRVRKAIQLAIDPQILMDRAFDGAVEGSTSLFPDWSTLATPTRAPEANLEEARKLLDEAKADGYDGKIEYMDNADGDNRKRALAVQAQLEAAGFEVELELTRTIAERIQRIAVDKDYHMSAWSFNVRESNPLDKFISAMHSSGTQTYSTYTSSEMDEHIEAFKAATDEQERLDAVDKIQQQLNEDVPFVTWAQFWDTFAWADHVHGIIGSSTSTALFSKAWLDK